MSENHADRFHLSEAVNSTDHILGPHTAGVAVVEYGDFECPDCKRVYPATQMLIDHFRHRIGFVYRHFPLTAVHPHAELAAEVSEVAGAQGKFWEMHAKLFEHQAHLDEKHLRGYAQDLGLDMARYDAELGDHIYLQRVQEHVAGAKKSGVRGTPTFYVNGTLHDVSFGTEGLMKYIQAALDGQGKR